MAKDNNAPGNNVFTALLGLSLLSVVATLGFVIFRAADLFGGFGAVFQIVKTG